MTRETRKKACDRWIGGEKGGVDAPALPRKDSFFEKGKEKSTIGGKGGPYLPFESLKRGDAKDSLGHKGRKSVLSVYIQYWKRDQERHIKIPHLDHCADIQERKKKGTHQECRRENAGHRGRG